MLQITPIEAQQILQLLRLYNPTSHFRIGFKVLKRSRSDIFIPICKGSSLMQIHLSLGGEMSYSTTLFVLVSYKCFFLVPKTLSYRQFGVLMCSTWVIASPECFLWHSLSFKDASKISALVLVDLNAEIVHSFHSKMARIKAKWPNNAIFALVLQSSCLGWPSGWINTKIYTVSCV